MTLHDGTAMTRRAFGGLAGAALTGLALPARAQNAAVSFMSFTFAEEPNKAFVQKLLDDCKASAGVTVEPIGSWLEFLFLEAATTGF